MTASWLAHIAVGAPVLAAAIGISVARHRLWAWGVALLGAVVAGGAAISECVKTAGGSAFVAQPLLGVSSFSRIDLGDTALTMSLRVDPISGIVAVAVALVALCVQLFSPDYLGDDGTDPAPRYVPYAASVSLFTAAMMLVVHANDFLTMLIGWEVMGLCSYVLIGHHSERLAARKASATAFLMTRAADVGFVLAVAVIAATAGTVTLTDINELAQSGGLDHGIIVLVTSLLVFAVIGKSAQFPFHPWLPDAMQGPTPVSALIHAATMVAAGVVALCKVHPLVSQAPIPLAVLSVIASFSMLAAAGLALAQHDAKRLLAWSTVSQIGMMLAAFGMTAALSVPDGAVAQSAALGHMVSHASFKALLFLGVGAATVAVGSTSLAAMRGLRVNSPTIAGLLIVGLLALAGIPGTIGFVSKEDIIGVALHAVQHGDGERLPWTATMVLVSTVLTAFITALYSTKFAIIVLSSPTGESESPDDGEPARQNRPVGATLIAPVGILGFTSILGFGLLWFRPHVLTHHDPTLIGLLAGLTPAVLGVAVGIMLFGTDLGRDFVAGSPQLRAAARDGFANPTDLARWVPKLVTRTASSFANRDRTTIDNASVQTARFIDRRGLQFGRLASGSASSYIAWALGATAILMAVVWR